MARYQHLPIYKLTYELLTALTKDLHGFPREYKFTIGQNLQAEVIGLVILIYRANSVQAKAIVIDEFLESLISKAEKRSTKIFANRLQLILSEIAHMYEKYERDGKLTMQDMGKFNRLNRLYHSITDHLVKAFDDAYILTQETRSMIYLEQYFRSAYVYEMSAQVQMGFGAIDPQAVEIAIKNPIPKLRLPKIMERNRKTIVSMIQEQIALGLSGGESYGQMAKRIRQVLGFAEHKARTIARTEAGRAQSKARLDSTEIAKQYVKIDKKWLATPDLRTRHAHRELDDQLAGEDGQFEYHGHKAPAPRLFMVPQLDINCRCTYLTIIDGEEPSTRRVRDYTDADYQQKLADRIQEYMYAGYTERQATKKAEKEVIPPSRLTKWMNYDTWYKDHTAA